jgi:hypothetical protein
LASICSSDVAIKICILGLSYHSSAFMEASVSACTALQRDDRTVDSFALLNTSTTETILLKSALLAANHTSMTETHA